MQTARKVAGVGSVGTRAWIILLRGPGGDPLFLQAKEAGPSVLAGYLDGPAFTNQGERVVTGQRPMQRPATSSSAGSRVPTPMDSDDDFDKALTAFAETYADQNERDHTALRKAIGDGRIVAHQGA